MTVRAVTKGCGMTFSGAGVIMRPSADKVAIATEIEIESGDRSQWGGVENEKMVRCFGCCESANLR